MIVFAWILWSYTLFTLIMVFIIMIRHNLRGEKYSIHFATAAFVVATFVFMTLYLFAR